ncbi:hypothetical protein ACYULU_15760 [Breznakiellaceae bacterium SP9]
MKRYILFGVLFASMALCSIFAAGVKEREGQPYAVSIFTTLLMHDYIDEGSFLTEAAPLEGDTADGTFRNGVLYWGGIGLLQKTGRINRGNNFQFRASNDDEYPWIQARYTGQPLSVNAADTYVLYGTLTFQNKVPSVEVRYIDIYNEEEFTQTLMQSLDGLY